MAPSYNENVEFSTWSPSDTFNHDEELEEATDELEALTEEVEDYEEASEEQDDTFRVRKIRGGNVRFEGDDFSVNGEVYEVSEKAYTFLTNLKDGYGRNYFEPA